MEVICILKFTQTVEFLIFMAYTFGKQWCTSKVHINDVNSFCCIFLHILLAIQINKQLQLVFLHEKINFTGYQSAQKELFII